jgi:hypothetical protein
VPVRIGEEVQEMLRGNGGKLNLSTCEPGRGHQRPEHTPPPVCVTQVGGTVINSRSGS